MWEMLEDVIGVSRETLNIITDINGYNTTTLEDVLYSVEGTHDFVEWAKDNDYDLRAITG